MKYAENVCRFLIKCIVYTGANYVNTNMSPTRKLAPNTIGIMCTIGGLGRHIGRQSTDSRPMVNRYIDRMSADASADM